MILRRGFLKGLLAAVPLGAAAVITGRKPEGAHPRRSPEIFRLNLDNFRYVDPVLLGYREKDPVADGLHGASAIALSPEGIPFVSLGSTILRSGKRKMETAVEGEGIFTAVAVSDAGALWTAAGPVLSAYDPTGRLTAEPIHLGERAYVTSLAVDGSKVFAADAGQRTIWVLAEDGTLKGRVDGRMSGHGGPGFVVPSPWFSLAASSGKLWVTNPGRQRVELYVDGGRKGAWGSASMAVEGFCGCCNPTHLALMPGGGFVTSEKGIPRIKVYDTKGALSSVVAGSDSFDEGTVGLAVAAAPDGRILVLDPVRGQVRVFTRRAEEVGA